MGYGRGYVLRKWQVRERPAGSARCCCARACCARARRSSTATSPGCAAASTATAAPVELERYPRGHRPGGLGRRRDPAPPRAPALAAALAPGRQAACAASPSFTSPTPAARRGRWRPSSPGSATRARSTWSSPARGASSRCSARRAACIQRDYEALTKPAPGRAAGSWLELRRLVRDVRAFRRLIRERRPELVLSVTTMLPAVPIAARLERVPALVYCGELFDRGFRGGAARALASRALAVLTGAAGGGDHRLLGHRRRAVHGGFGDGRDRLPAGRRALRARRRRPACASGSGSTPEAPVPRLGRLPDRGPGPGPAGARDAGDPRAAARTRATCSPAIRSRGRRTSPTASAWWPGGRARAR